MTGKTKSLIDQYKVVHNEDSCFGNSSMCHYPLISHFVNLEKPHSIIDYGCGKSNLVNSIASRFSFIKRAERYDPAIQGIDKEPDDCLEFVINTDVLEHIPEKDIYSFLCSVRAIAEKGLFVIHLDYAVKVLPNGDNAHCTVKPRDWWRSRLEEVFLEAYPVLSLSMKHCAFMVGCKKPKYLLIHNIFVFIKQVFSRKSMYMLKQRIKYYT